MQIALLGAGHIGQTIARVLADCGDYSVTIADQSTHALGRLHDLNAQRVLLQLGQVPLVMSRSSPSQVDGLTFGAGRAVLATIWLLGHLRSMAQWLQQIG
jgi:saccharopine dehydrogenase-like NADP-dependent oxidoreductase